MFARFAARRLEGSVQLGERLSRADTLQYRFTYRDVFVDPNSVKINPQLIPILSQSVRVGQLWTTLIHDRRDDPTDAHRGMYQTIDWATRRSVRLADRPFLRVVWRTPSYYRMTRDWTFARTHNFGLINRLGGLPTFRCRNAFSQAARIRTARFRTTRPDRATRSPGSPSAAKPC